MKTVIQNNYRQVLIVISEEEKRALMFEVACAFAERYCSNLQGVEDKALSQKMLRDGKFWQWFNYAWTNHNKYHHAMADYEAWKRHEFLEKNKFFVWWNKHQNNY